VNNPGKRELEGYARLNIIIAKKVILKVTCEILVGLGTQKSTTRHNKR